MHTLKVMKSARTVNKVVCSCSYITFADNSVDAEYLAYIHSLKHKHVTLETYVDGEFQNPNTKRALPSRNRGRTTGALE